VTILVTFSTERLPFWLIETSVTSMSYRFVVFLKGSFQEMEAALCFYFCLFESFCEKFTVREVIASGVLPETLFFKLFAFAGNRVRYGFLFGPVCSSCLLSLEAIGLGTSAWEACGRVISVGRDPWSGILTRLSCLHFCHPSLTALRVSPEIQASRPC